MFRVSVCFTGQTLVRIYKKCMGKSLGSRLTNTFTMSCLPHFWLFMLKTSLSPAFVSERLTVLYHTLSNPFQAYCDYTMHAFSLITDDAITLTESTNLTCNCSRIYSEMLLYVKQHDISHPRKFFFSLLIRTEHRELIKICRKQFAQLT